MQRDLLNHAGDQSMRALKIDVSECRETDQKARMLKTESVTISQSEVKLFSRNKLLIYLVYSLTLGKQG